MAPLTVAQLKSLALKIVVVRTGNTIATFSELSIGKDLFFPPELITRQVERLRNAQPT
ncbi:hypothetical protein STAN_3542 [Streptomyces sp. CBMAI 2042]|nr:hypothetical protein STAN_3542 [Streptomyces sp. CBMAI 2042]